MNHYFYLGTKHGTCLTDDDCDDIHFETLEKAIRHHQSCLRETYREVYKYVYKVYAPTLVTELKP
jgi:hypothetical protein